MLLLEKETVHHEEERSLPRDGRNQDLQGKEPTPKREMNLQEDEDVIPVTQKMMNPLHHRVEQVEKRRHHKKRRMKMMKIHHQNDHHPLLVLKNIRRPNGMIRNKSKNYFICYCTVKE